MKGFDKSKWPVLDRGSRKATPITRDRLRETGLNMGQYGIQKGDTITMPTSWDEAHFEEIPIRVGSTAMMQVVAVEKNGKPNWLALGSLIRRDVNNKAVDPLAEDMLKLDNHELRVEALFGKVITASDEKTIEAAKFENNARVPGSVERTVAVATYA